MKNLFGILFVLLVLVGCQKEDLGVELKNPAQPTHRSTGADAAGDTGSNDTGDITDPDEDDDESDQDVKPEGEITDPDSDDDERDLDVVIKTK